jgi:hypothetical protein
MQTGFIHLKAKLGENAIPSIKKILIVANHYAKMEQKHILAQKYQ